MNYPIGIIETPIGLVRFAMTEASHVFLHTESRTDEAVTIRKIRYHVNFHLHLIDGAWGVKDWHEPYLSRRDTYSQDASQPARKTARDVLTKAWTEYLAAHSDLSLAAEKDKAQEAIDRANGELAELREQVKAKEAELSKANDYLWTTLTGKGS